MKYVLIIGGNATLPPISYQVYQFPTNVNYYIWNGTAWIHYTTYSQTDNETGDYYYSTLEQPANTFSFNYWRNDTSCLDLPDFVLGRFPSDDPQEIQNMVTKTVSYEQTTSPGKWVRTSALVVGVDAPDPWQYKLYTTDDRPRLSLVYPQNLTFQTLVDLFNQGVGSIFIDAHAGPDSWSLTYNESLSYSNVGSLTNSKLPVIFSEGCHSGKFDDPIWGPSVAAKMLGQPIGGAVAIVAGTSYTPYGDYVYLSAYNYWKNCPNISERLPNANYHIGEAFYYFVALNPVIEYMILLGDPSLVLATANYDAPVQRTEYSIAVAGSTYEVVTVSNSSVSGCKMNTTSKEIVFTVTGTSGTVGFCNITFPTQLLGGPYIMLIDGSQRSAAVTSNATHASVYLTYSHSTHNVEIIGVTVVPEFPTIAANVLVLAVLALILLVAKRCMLNKTTQKPSHTNKI